MSPRPLLKLPVAAGQGIPTAAGIVLAIGLLLRLTQYGLLRGFWGDEAFLLYNAGTLPAGQLLTGPLNAVTATQSAPPLFMLSLRGLMELGGKAEWLMRLLPILAGFLSLIVTFVVARRYLEVWPAALATGLLATSASCVFQSANVKPYSFDVLTGAVAVGVGWWGLSPMADLRRASWAVTLLLLSTALVGWLSFGGLFAFAGTAAALILARPATTRSRGPWLAGFAAVAGVVFLWWVNLRHQSSGDLETYWKDAFAPWSEPVRLPLWLIKTTIGLVVLVQRTAGWALLPLVAYGLWRRDRQVCLALAPIAVFLAVGILGVYPAKATRVTLAVVPGVALACGAALQGLQVSDKWSRWIAAGGFAVFLWGMGECINEFARPFNERDTQPAVQHVLSATWSDESVTPLLGCGSEVWCYWVAGDKRLEHAGKAKYAATSGWFIVVYARDRKDAVLAEAEKRFARKPNLERSWVGPMSAALWVAPVDERRK